MANYLEDLTVRLATGIAELESDRRARHAAFFKAAQQPDGGFAGREGDSDLYYTGFALRGLAVSGELHGEVAERAARFLRGRLGGRESVVDFLSLIYGASLLGVSAGVDVFSEAASGWQQSVANSLEELRRGDGGYAKGPEGAASSTYHSFLVVLCLQLIERPVPQPHRLVEFVLSQQSREGGFREIRNSKRAGTNPTAAAIGTLRTLHALDRDICASTIEFLADMQTDEGGLRANTRIPIADLLSSFTGVLTLSDLGGIEEIDVDAIRRYAISLEAGEGGFYAAAWDQARDVEYTFYGLGCLGLLRRAG